MLTIKKNIRIASVVAICIIFFFIGFSCKTNTKDNGQLLKVESVALKFSTGWGYNILVDQKIFIHQEFIPVIQGKKAFATKEDALKTANVAIQKILKGEQPIITKSDLDSLKISME